MNSKGTAKVANQAQREHGHRAGRDPMRFDQSGGRAHGHRRHQICDPQQLPQDEAFAVIRIRESHRHQGRGRSDGDVPPPCGQREQARQKAVAVQREEGETSDPPGLKERQRTRVQGQNELAKCIRGRRTAGISAEYMQGPGDKRKNEPGANQRGREFCVIWVRPRHNNFSLCGYCNSVTALVTLSASFSKLSLSSFPS